MKMTVRHLLQNREGLTLFEVLLAFTVLLIISVAFFHMFVFAASVNKKSEDILDATYVAQSILEERYAESKSGKPIPASSGLVHHSSGYWVRETVIKKDGNLVGILVQVYTDAGENQLEAQMETYFLWNAY